MLWGGYAAGCFPSAVDKYQERGVGKTEASSRVKDVARTMLRDLSVNLNRSRVDDFHTLKIRYIAMRKLREEVGSLVQRNSRIFVRCRARRRNQFRTESHGCSPDSGGGNRMSVLSAFFRFYSAV